MLTQKRIENMHAEKDYDNNGDSLRGYGIRRTHKNVEVARIVIDFTITIKEVEDIVDALGSAFMDPARFAIHLNTTNI